MSTIHERIQSEIDKRKEKLLSLSHEIHANPEIRFEEHKAADLLASTLEEEGFEVERGVGNLPTAFKARAFSKNDGPTVAMLCEYDALEGLGHACGHNVIATMGLGAALALKPLMDDLKGNLMVLGTPGEEGGGGKVILLEEGLFDDVDAALMIHPFNENIKASPALARVAWEVRYKGKPAHAAAAPHLGVNALDAVRLAFNGMDALRQQVTPDTRMHAIINHGGDVANVIPHKASLKIYIRAATRDYLYDSLLPRMKGVFEGAALMTGCIVDIEEIAKPYDNMVINMTLADSFEQHAKRIGRSFAPFKIRDSAGSSDIGNVSQMLPCLHGYLAIHETANPHTVEFAEAAHSSLGDKTVLEGAAILASVGADLFSDPELLASAKAESVSAGNPLRQR